MRRPNWGLVALGAILLVGIIVVLVSQQDTSPPSGSTKPTREVVEAKARTLTYEQLFRYNEKYIGEYVVLKGKVVQLIDDGKAFRLATRYDSVLQTYWEDDVYVSGYSGERLMEDDIVRVYGQVKGLFSYITVLGAKRTIPWVVALYVDRLRRG